MILGITGSIGSGKTTVSRIFEKYGFLVINADEVGHKFLTKGTEQYKQLLKYFGDGVLDLNENIDRKKLSDIAFSEKKKYVALNKIMIPPIIKEIKKIMDQNKEKDIVIDAPILLETRAKEFVNKVVVVKTNNSNVLRRNRKFSKNRIFNVKKYQMPITEKLKHADFVINNDGNTNSLENQVKNITYRLNNKI